MIYGIQAAQPDSGGIGGNPYPDALAVADFVLGEYWIGDSEVTAASMVDKPELISASGLRIQYSTPGGKVNVIGQLLVELLLANNTFVLEYQELQGDNFFGPLWMSDESSAAGGDNDKAYFYNEATTLGFYDQPDPGADRESFHSGLTALPGIRRGAVTRTNAKCAMSVNGNAVISDTTATSTPSHDTAIFGGQPNQAFAEMDGYIRRLIIYSEQTDAALPALSIV